MTGRGNAAAGGAADSALHVVLLGDSIFDNGAYTAGGLDGVTELARALPRGARSSPGER
jgi:hypothetical protein